MGNSNTFLTPTIIAKEALMMLENEMVMGSKVHRDYKNEFKKIGETLTIRAPNKYTVTKARTRTESTNTEKSITMTVSTQAHVSWDFTTIDLTMTIDEYSDRYIKPAANALANQVDADLCALYKYVYNDVYESTGFITPESFLVLGKAGQKLDEEAAPKDNRVLVLNPAANWSLANALRTVYVQDIAKPALTKGYMATIAGFDIYMDQNITTHQTGLYNATTGTVIVTGTGTQQGTSIVLGQFTIVSTSVLKIGDVFTIANVYAVNPVSGLSTGSLRQFVVTANASCIATETTSANNVTVYISPEIIDTGAYKTVNQAPAAGAKVTIVGSASATIPKNLAFQKNAFALVVVPLEMPQGVWGARATNKKTGLSIRVLKDYDVDTDEEICRMDILYGVKCLRPELACRISGAAVSIT
jgi:hypothetical protein